LESLSVFEHLVSGSLARGCPELRRQLQPRAELRRLHQRRQPQIATILQVGRVAIVGFVRPQTHLYQLFNRVAVVEPGVDVLGISRTQLFDEWVPGVGFFGSGLPVFPDLPSRFYLPSVDRFY